MTWPNTFSEVTTRQSVCARDSGSSPSCPSAAITNFDYLPNVRPHRVWRCRSASLSSATPSRGSVEAVYRLTTNEARQVLTCPYDVASCSQMCMREFATSITGIRPAVPAVLVPQKTLRVLQIMLAISLPTESSTWGSTCSRRKEAETCIFDGLAASHL